MLEAAGVEAGGKGVPVAVGATRPMAQDVHYALDWHGRDGLGDTNLPEPAGRPVPGSAAEQIVRTARERPGEVVLLATGVGLPIAFFALNGWLLGRDLGDMVAARHMTNAELVAWRTDSRWTRLGAGLASAGLFAIPVVNLIAPVVGAAAMTHLFHQRRGRTAHWTTA